MTIPDPEIAPLLDVHEAARWLGIGRTACYEAIQRGEIPHLRLGRRIYVPTAAIRALVGLAKSTTIQPDDGTQENEVRLVGDRGRNVGSVDARRAAEVEQG